VINLMHENRISLRQHFAYLSIVALVTILQQEKKSTTTPTLLTAQGIQIVNCDGQKVLEIGSDPFGGHLKIWASNPQGVAPRPGVQMGTSIVPGSSNFVLQNGWSTSDDTRVAAAVRGSPGVSSLLIEEHDGNIVRLEDCASK
jgi:hypothetical protein